MKKVGIVTLTAVYNYGNSLQNYAVLKKIESLGYHAKTIYFDFSGVGIKSFIKRAIKNPFYHRRILAYRKFEKKYLQVFRGRTLRNLDGQFDYFVVGSDQVWNTRWYGSSSMMKDIYLLSFAGRRKRISFSASFGIDEVQDDYRKIFSEELENFKELSVREESGAKIIRELTGRSATVLVDPTLLLTQDEWRRLEKKPRKAKSGYILTYFLSPKCETAKKELTKIQHGRYVYNLLDSYDAVTRTSGPTEFLWLFDHADLILTDSFHACVFSFLFNKPFVVYDRNWNDCNMNSRLETLLKKFHLERKYANSGLENDIWEHNYEDGYKQLELERQKATDFLKKALDC